MYTFLTIIYVLVCIALIGIVLLQQGKGADMGASFGGSSQTFFGGSGATTLLGKLTAGAALLFMVTAIGISLMQLSESKGTDLMDFDEPAAQSAPAPLALPPVAPVPAAPAAAPAAEGGEQK
jgi:preprotein translocase subunit SecG